MVQDGELGKRFVDKLVQVNRLSGQEDWIYIHLEVQGTAQAEFAERMFVYNYRIYDRYRRPVASMAVLADDTPTPLPWSLAHLQTRATRAGPQARYAAKWKLVQLLYRRGWDKQRIIDLFSVIDWMMVLPEMLKNQLWQNLNNLEQEKKWLM